MTLHYTKSTHSHHELDQLQERRDVVDVSHQLENQAARQGSRECEGECERGPHAPHQAYRRRQQQLKQIRRLRRWGVVVLSVFARKSVYDSGSSCGY